MVKIINFIEKIKENLHPTTTILLSENDNGFRWGDHPNHHSSIKKPATFSMQKGGLCQTTETYGLTGDGPTLCRKTKIITDIREQNEHKKP